MHIPSPFPAIKEILTSAAGSAVVETMLTPRLKELMEFDAGSRSYEDEALFTLLVQEGLDEHEQKCLEIWLIEDCAPIELGKRSYRKEQFIKSTAQLMHAPAGATPDEKKWRLTNALKFIKAFANLGSHEERTRVAVAMQFMKEREEDYFPNKFAEKRDAAFAMIGDAAGHVATGVATAASNINTAAGNDLININNRIATYNARIDEEHERRGLGGILRSMFDFLP